MSASIKMKSSLDDIIDKEIKIDDDHDNLQKITEKNSGKEFQKRNIYIVDKNNGQEIGIGHIVYTKTNITLSQNKNNEALKKTFINYVYLINIQKNI